MRVLGMLYYLQQRTKLLWKCWRDVNRSLLVCINRMKIIFHLLCVCVHQVEGIKGMLIANKRQDNQVKTFITYNKGRDWRLLQAPATDLDGNDIHCILVRHCFYCRSKDFCDYVENEM